MEHVCARADLEAYVQARRSSGAVKIGFVPTMGALHAGHMSLVRHARQVCGCDCVVLSVFVNPAQFSPGEDLDAYPRTLKADSDVAVAAGGVDVIYTPSVPEMYPHGVDQLDAGAVQGWLGDDADGLESEFRPHFFAGVVQVVSRLFDHVAADVAVFGEKDYQQLQVMRQMVALRGYGPDIAAAPLIRDQDGLALSSRNVYLSAQERKQAVTLHRALLAVAEGALTEEAAAATLLEAGFASVDYIARRWGRVLGAAWLGGTRLIDNL